MADAGESFRTAGQSVGGRLHRGAVGTVVVPSSSNNKWPVRPSIPSRVETVLHRDRPSGEDRAFGSSSYRFLDAPADGRALGTEYQAQDSSLKARNNKLNVSSKGTAAFASAKPAGFAADAPVRPLPGPAHYSPPAPPARVTSCGFAFSKPKGGRAVGAKYGSEVLGNPGPGSYTLPEPRAPCSASMQSKAQRGAVLNAGGPGPGEFLPDSYINMTAFRASSTGAFQAAPQGGSHFNKSKTQRGVWGSSAGAAIDTAAGGGGGLLPGAASLPAPLMRVREADLSPHVAAALAQSASAPGAQPLRAAPDLSSSADRGGSGSRPSAVFRETNLDRFGNPIVRYVTRADDSKVGPGSYLALPMQKRKLISSAWALDTTKQHAVERDSVAPGPAFYSPVKSAHNSATSFHVRENLPKADLTAAKFRGEATIQRHRPQQATWI